MAISVGQSFVVCLWPASFTLKAQGRFRGYLRLQLLQMAVAAVTNSLAAAYCGSIVKTAMSAFGATCTPEAAAPLAVAISAAVLLACFGPLTLWLACKRTRIGPWPVLDTITRPWLAALPCAITAGWVTRAAERADIERLGLAALVAGVSAVMIVAGVAGAIALRPSTRHDASELLQRLGSRLRRSFSEPGQGAR
jgi:mannose/fructose/N-acetylgalactosamine-specific phosphotransferase system component IIC